MPAVLVIGASRGIGLETVKAALADGHRVRAFARTASSIAMQGADLEKRDGTALDAAAVTQALPGMDAVIQTLGADERARPQTLLTGTTLFSRSTRILVDAMRAAGVRRLVTVTGLGAGDSRGHGGFLYDALVFPLILKRVYDDKDVQEQIIRSSGLDWTIVRPGLLSSGPATGRARPLTDPRDWMAGTVSRADVGQFLVREAFERRFLCQTPLLIQ
jgi:uncharacterized protein YbjT (DUF2867 family)